MAESKVFYSAVRKAERLVAVTDEMMVVMLALQRGPQRVDN